jgi:CubicO group peptidase (beta-lactamase class C family)
MSTNNGHVSWVLTACLTSMVACAHVGPGAATPPALLQLKSNIESGQIPNVHSVLIRQHGKMIAEWYFAGPDARRDGADLGTVHFAPETLHDIRSSSKSIVSLLFAIALAEGSIHSIDDAALDYFPELADLATPDKRKITLRNLLTMSSGFHWDEYSYPYTDPRNSETAMDAAADRYRYLFSLPLDVEPGTRFRYSGGDVALIAAVISHATKMPIDDYLRRKLLAPLGITTFEWVKDSHGIPVAASGLRLRSPDMMKIGILMAQGGQYEGRQVVPRPWIDAATTRQMAVDTGSPCDPESTDHPSGMGFLQYGYFWWVGPGCAAQGRSPWFSAIGNGGERITVIPSLELVIVTTAGLYDDPRQAAVNQLVQSIERALSPPSANARPIQK